VGKAIVLRGAASEGTWVPDAVGAGWQPARPKLTRRHRRASWRARCMVEG
jgi:hypothetical protein